MCWFYRRFSGRPSIPLGSASKLRHLGSHQPRSLNNGWNKTLVNNGERLGNFPKLAGLAPARCLTVAVIFPSVMLPSCRSPLDGEWPEQIVNFRVAAFATQKIVSFSQSVPAEVS